jgi:hypothetical protein
MVAGISLFQTTRLHGMRLTDHARMSMDARAALDLLQHYGRLAGYGVHLLDADRPGRTARPMLRGCAGGPARPQSRGANPRSTSPSCGINAAGTDSLVIRYRADAVSAWRGMRSHLPSDCEGRAVPASARYMIDARFVIREDRARPGERRLHCARQGGAAGEPQVESIDTLRLRYWLAGQPHAADARYLAESDWFNVVGFEACVIVKGAVRGGAVRYRDCEQQWQLPAQDGFQRKAYSVVVASRNE